MEEIKMTFCAAFKVEEGLVGIADTRVTTGSEYLTAKKITIHQNLKGKHAFFIMTSGLRSVRDKTITYFNEVIEEQDVEFNKLYKAVNAFALQVKRAADEDKKSLAESGLYFNLYALIAGQLEDDDEHKVYMLYPEGNWVEVGQSSPYFIIGNSGYGKPLLDRVLTYQSTMEFALKAGFLAFEATRISANDVGFPLDIVLLKKDKFSILEHRFQREELHKYSKWWQEKISNGINELPNDWVKSVFSKFNG